MYKLDDILLIMQFSWNNFYKISKLKLAKQNSYSKLSKTFVTKLIQ